MVDQRIDSLLQPVRPALGVSRTGTATDRRPRRQEGEDRRNPKGQSRLKRQIYDLLFEEIDRVEELAPPQRERLKRNIRAHLALQAQQPPSSIPPPPPSAAVTPSAPPVQDEHSASEVEPETEPPPNQEDGGDADHEALIGIAAPVHSGLPMDEVEQNTMLAQQLRDCLARHSDVAKKVATYLHLLLSIDGALAPHVIVEI